MNKSVKYNISLNVKVLKDIFSYFDMNENNTIVKLLTKNKKVLDILNKEYKDNIIDIKDGYVYLKNINFAKLFYIFSKHVVLNVYYYKVKKKDINKLNTDNTEVFIHTRMDIIYEIYFNEKYDYDKTINYLKQYKRVKIEYIIIIILLIIGLLLRLGR